MSEQNKIADILSDLDRQIQINQKINNTLEKIGQNIFKHWFINFEFPNEDGKPYKSDGGQMVSSNLGKVPVGWEMGKLGEYVNVIKGCSYRSSDLKESKTALVTLKSMDRGGGLNDRGFKEFTGKHNKEQELLEGDIVVAMTDLTQKAEVLGTPARIRSVPQYEKLIASLDLCVVRPKFAHLNRNFIYHTLNTKTFHNHSVSYANGTTVLHLSKNAIPNYDFIIPEKQIIDKFGILSQPLFEKISINNLESENLNKLRDSLLPKLISGRIRVKGDSM